jgi:hypothetical protein
MKEYTIRTMICYSQTNTVRASTEAGAKELSEEMTLRNLSEDTVEYDHDIESVTQPII